MTFEEKEKRYSELLQKAAEDTSSVFIEDAGEGHDLELDDIYLEDVSGWLVPIGTPPERWKSDEWYCFAEWELDGKEVTIRFNKH